MADTKTKKYKVNETYYRNQTGKLHHPGEVVEIPHDEKPAMNWTPLEDDAPAAPKEQKPVTHAPAPTHGTHKGGRTSDKDAI